MLSVHATDGVQVLLAGLLDKISKVFPKQQAEINGNGPQTPRPGEPKGLGLWPCYRWPLWRPGSSPGGEGVVVRRVAAFPAASSVGVARSPRVGVPTVPRVVSSGWWVCACVILTASDACFGGARWGVRPLEWCGVRWAWSSFLNPTTFPEGKETPPLAVAVSDNQLHEVEAFVSHLPSIHVREFSVNFYRAGSAL